MLMNLTKLKTPALRVLAAQIKDEIAEREARQAGSQILGFTLAKCAQGSSHNWQAYGYVQGQRVVVSLGKSLAEAEGKIARAIARKEKKK